MPDAEIILQKIMFKKGGGGYEGSEPESIATLPPFVPMEGQ
jgi:hypothetical protein